jgi:flagellar hook-basal body complex protein FliE
LVWPGFAFIGPENIRLFGRAQEEFVMEFTPMRPIQPLWESISAQPAERTWQSGSALFASVFQSAIDNVRETNKVKTDLEYRLATGQIDNPTEVTLAITKAGAASDLLVEMRNKAVETYNELMRISM